MTRRPYAAIVLVAVSAACELREITLVEVENVVVAEIYANIAADPGDNEIRAFLHRTVGSVRDGLDDLDRARITVRRADGMTIRLAPDPRSSCLASVPVEETGTCFLSDSTEASSLRAGDLLEVEVELPDEGRLSGATRVPAPFDIAGVPRSCRLEPDTPMALHWSRSEGAWAYLDETSVHGLPEALAAEGIEMDDDPLYLLGLSISAGDTTVVFPSEFGIFNRFELDQDVALRLQRGLPAGTTADVTITAVERNYVNWARQGTFNPSGQVRVPSLLGDGTGVFAGAVSRHLLIVSDPPGEGLGEDLEDCPTS